MGVVYALLILIGWGTHLVYSLLYQQLELTDLTLWFHLLLQTWLFTGLFITAHDAMHGTVAKNKMVNNTLGALASMLYAGLWYPKLLKKHYLHHLHPGTAQDPDYTVGSQNFFAWWYRFMIQYITVWQVLIMAVLFNIGLIWFNESRLFLLWILPSVLSTYQLFYFGTFLPHRLPHADAMAPHMARSQPRNHLIAMITCYFFGYHFEHHASPRTPWWQLYRIKQR